MTRPKVITEAGWTNASVLALAGGFDPLMTVVDKARDLLVAAIDAGLAGPPFDPFELAALMGLGVRAHADVADARIGPSEAQAPRQKDQPLASFVPSQVPLTVEYNPTRPRGRLRYSVAHEIAHALFPDVAETVRHRTGTGSVPGYGDGDSWQLELLCNVAGAEVLMPTHAVEGLLDIDPDIDFLMATRARFDVSTEALLRRLAHDTPRPLAVVATCRVADSMGAPLRVEYVAPSRSWAPQASQGLRLKPSSVFGETTAVGQTARGQIEAGGERLRTQTVGIPGYPGRSFPRVLGLVEPCDAPRTAPAGIHYVSGDVSEPEAEGPLVIAHLVPDSGHAWGRRGVARALAARFPDAAAAFRAWTIASPDNLLLGRVHAVDVGRKRPTWVASMVAQRGHGPSVGTRLVYSALAEAMDSVAALAHRTGASVHLPRIGAGEAGGRWDLIEHMIDRSLVRSGVSVAVYTPPSTPRPTHR